ncbi:MAG: DUF4468 domain-containing protein [Dysgonamonadaceae bacterium]|jgi:hypothetical protein|nr:DUF4468 domain-containing protein [Dysgonamonadaceae bacterium]
MSRKSIISVVVLMVLFTSNQMSICAIDSIPLVNGKIVFKEYIKTNVGQKDIHDKLYSYINNDLQPVEGNVLINEPNKIVCNITDYIVINQHIMQTFAMYMNYILSLEFNDGLCLAKVRDIKFMEKESFEKQKEWDENPNNIMNYTKSDSILFPVYTAEQIFLNKDYSLTFYKRASQRITKYAIYRIEEIFEEANDALTLTEKELDLIKRKIERERNKK